MQHAKAYSAGSAIRELERQVEVLKARNLLLQARLELAGIDITDAPPWLVHLTPSQRRIMYALYVASPFEVDRWDLLIAMGSERDAGLGCLIAQITKIRDRLGTDAVEAIPGAGYRLGPHLRKPQITPGDT
jgi:hypothetical protein